MSSHDRRAAARRRAWGRGPVILRFEPLEGRRLLTALPALPDLVASSIATPGNAYWGQTFQVSGTVANQGFAGTNAPFQVEIFASPKPTIGPRSLELGVADVPAGLAVGASGSFSQTVTLPPTPIAGLPAGQNQTIYLSFWVNPSQSLTESNYRNDLNLGRGIDTSVVAITPLQPSNPTGTAVGASPTVTTWGSTITVANQIENEAQGDAPATQALVELTPSGVAVGGFNSVQIGLLNVPPIAAWQTVNVAQSITLPALPPALLANTNSFTLSVVEDANYQTNPEYPHLTVPANEATITIGPGAASTDTTTTPTSSTTSSTTTTDGSTTTTTTSSTTTAPSTTALPDLAATTVQGPTPLTWGHAFQISTMVQNVGTADSGPFQVQFVLTGSGGDLTHSLYLGDETVNGLAMGGSIVLNPTLSLPAQVPNGMVLSSLGLGRVGIIINPNNVVEESTTTNNSAESSPVVLRVLGTDGSSKVPMSPPIGAVVVEQSPTTTTATAAPTAMPSLREQLRLALTERPGTPAIPRAMRVGPRAELSSRPAPSNNSNVPAQRLLLVTTGGKKTTAPTNTNTFGQQLVALPRRVGDLFSNLFSTGVSKF